MPRKNNQVVLNEPMGFVQLDSLTLLVKAIGTRIVYGRREYLVTPVSGTGEKWVYGKQIRWTEEPVLSTVQKVEQENKGEKNAVR